VLVVNMRAAALKRLGLGYDGLNSFVRPRVSRMMSSAMALLHVILSEAKDLLLQKSRFFGRSLP
jgi:hypothetical protein